MRTTSENVGDIIELDASIDPTPFMLVANELVTELCLASGYTETRLELIERWLAAHFYTNRDPRSTDEKAGPVSVTYQSAVDLNLNSSHYGQTAMMLDTAGNLKTLNNKKAKRVLSVSWLGKPEAEQDDVEDEV